MVYVSQYEYFPSNHVYTFFDLTIDLRSHTLSLELDELIVARRVVTSNNLLKSFLLFTPNAS